MKQKLILAAIALVWPIIIDYSFCPDGDFFCSDYTSLFISGLIFFSGGCFIAFFFYLFQKKWLIFWRVCVTVSVLLSTLAALSNYYTI